MWEPPLAELLSTRSPREAALENWWTSVIMKFTCHDRLGPGDMMLETPEGAAGAQRVISGGERPRRA